MGGNVDEEEGAVRRDGVVGTCGMVGAVKEAAGRGGRSRGCGGGEGGRVEVDQEGEESFETAMGRGWGEVRRGGRGDGGGVRGSG